MEKLRVEEPRLIFIDECAINTDLARLYGRAPKGERVHGTIPRNTHAARSVIGALAPEGLIAVMDVEGAIDGEAFAVFVRCCLGPQLRPDDIVLLDNNNTHRHPGAQRCIEEAGAWLVRLPAYSPDLNPIEQCWAKMKTILRSAAARTQRALRRALKKAVMQITPENAKAWFENLGYWVSPECNPL